MISRCESFAGFKGASRWSRLPKQWRSDFQTPMPASWKDLYWWMADIWLAHFWGNMFVVMFLDPNLTQTFLAVHMTERSYLTSSSQSDGPGKCQFTKFSSIRARVNLKMYQNIITPFFWFSQIVQLVAIPWSISGKFFWSRSLSTFAASSERCQWHRWPDAVSQSVVVHESLWTMGWYYSMSFKIQD